MSRITATETAAITAGSKTAEMPLSLQERLHKMGKVTKKKRALQEGEFVPLAALNAADLSALQSHSLSNRTRLANSRPALRVGNTTFQSSALLGGEGQVNTTVKVATAQANTHAHSTVVVSPLFGEKPISENSILNDQPVTALSVSLKTEPQSAELGAQEDRQRMVLPWLSTTLSPLFAELKSVTTAQRPALFSPPAPKSELIPIEGKADGQLKYQFTQWGQQHSVNIQTHGIYHSNVLLQPSDSLVHQRMSEHLEQGEGRWQLSDDQRDRSQQDRPQQPPQEDED